LLLALEVAADPRRARIEQVLDLLTGPIIRFDPSDLRRLGRALRDARRAAGASLAPARELIAELICTDEQGIVPASIEPTSFVAMGVQRARQLLADVRARIQAGAPLAEILWVAWTGGPHPHGWPDRLRELRWRGRVRPTTTSMRSWRCSTPPSASASATGASTGSTRSSPPCAIRPFQPNRSPRRVRGSSETACRS